MSKLLIKLFKYKHKRKCFNLTFLHKMTAQEISLLLKEYNFVNESNIFLNENIDGSTFIMIFSEKKCLKLLKNDLKLSEYQILLLKELYRDIYNYRKLHGSGFRKKYEKPCY